MSNTGDIPLKHLEAVTTALNELDTYQAATLFTWGLSVLYKYYLAQDVTVLEFKDAVYANLQRCIDAPDSLCTFVPCPPESSEDNNHVH